MRLADSQSSVPTSNPRGSRSSVKRRARWFHPQLEQLEHRCLLSIAPSTVVGRFVFYDNSHYDGGIAGVNSSDDHAIASDKSALLNGSGPATFANVTSYTLGINGVMVDISGSHPGITSNDFTFRVGNNNSPSSWAPAPPTSVTVRAGQGSVSGSDRVEILWANNAIQNEWLEVIVAADRNTGLAASDIFFFGNAIGDSGQGDTAALAVTNSTDELAARNNTATLLNNIPITNAYDYNRDGLVNTTDQLVDRNHPQTINAAKFVSISPASPPALAAALANDTGSSNSDSITSDSTVTGTITGANAITSFKAGFNNGPVTTDALSLLQGGAFTLTPSFLATVNGGTLPDGAYTLHLQAVDSQGLSAAVDLLVILRTATPSVTVSTLASYGDDLTPQVTVTASEALGLPTGTQVSLDVDLNNDGDFTDPGEQNRTLSSLFQGSTIFNLTPALPPTDPIAGPYTVQLRAHVTDVAGNTGFSPLWSLKIDTLGNTILQDYVNTPDPTYSYSLASTIPGTIPGLGNFTEYIYNLHSQTWRSSADVNNPLWQHWLQVIVPSVTLNSSALLLIDGGSNSATPPTSANTSLATLALASHSVTVDLPEIPNEPLTFTGDPGDPRTEDAIVAYSFNQFITNLGQPGDNSWPVLLPMVKSAVRAMDTVQAVVPGLVANAHVDNFVVTGYSKRGWTTWLTAAVDSRVIGIIPGVFDALNLDEQMIHHQAFYSGIPAGPTLVDGFSIYLQDYVAFGIPENTETAQGQELDDVVDPYKYLNNGHFNIPKLEINSSGDQFFIPDAAQFYFNDLPGTQNYLRYLPNTGHGLNGTDTANSTATFYNAIINHLPLPQFSWTVQPNGSIHVQTVTTPTNVVMWMATAPTYRDFRQTSNSNTPDGTGPVYSSTTLTDQGGGTYIASATAPTTGAVAFFIQLTFTSPLTGNPYIFTTQIQVLSKAPLAPWPFFTAVGAALPPADNSEADFSPIASGLAAPLPLSQPVPIQRPSTAANTSAADAVASAGLSGSSADSSVDDWPWLELDGTSDRESTSSNTEATDLVLASLSPDDPL